ncbi:hypothetical protein PPTG_14287 [Phytophthora nicotianae INRA-310]|uniref:Uncharacterized protein n=1 Tax=Phytophthora nicotianae (strain INRA-310) TaxID=761204 RepID=W2PXF5_PHYN3|nr:hypothetical protein PPTG_14287 [Phytophthora nicotianae INRA-310]ETN05587.1 hypothetical protein PPTG_14287 [Phytophthora nicotianae INRA-310]
MPDRERTFVSVGGQRRSEERIGHGSRHQHDLAVTSSNLQGNEDTVQAVAHGQMAIAITTSFVEVNADDNAKEDYLSATKSISVDSTLQYFKDAQEKIDKEAPEAGSGEPGPDEES